MKIETTPVTFLQMLQDHLKEKITHAEAAKYRLEGSFLKEKVVPELHTFLVSLGYSSGEARNAILAEGYKDPLIKDFASGTPSSSPRYPFKKGILSALRSATKDWWEKGKGLYASCPDFALLSPHRIVFEGKLYREGGVETARSEIVRAVYECAFYRGLSTLLVEQNDAVAHYDFACLLAFDSSKGQSFVAAWNSLNDEVKRAFWEELRVYAIALPGGAPMADLRIR